MMKYALVIVLLVLVKLYLIGSAPAPATPTVAAQEVPSTAIAPRAVSTLVSAPVGRKSVVTQTMQVGAHFDTVNCAYWGFQVNCKHWGTDFTGSEGEPVFAPYDLTIIALGSYPPGPTWGQYIQGTFPDGYVFYAGHLEDRPTFKNGQTLPAGTFIGRMNSYAHTHIQLAPPAVTGPCAQSGTCVDFEQYYATH